MKKLFKILRSIPIFFYKNLYLIMALAALYSLMTRDYIAMLDIAVLALIAIGIELRGQNDNNKIENAVKLLKTILEFDKEKQKKCDLYSDVSKCPDNKTCNKCKYFN
jgi:hypothetical protein